MSDSKNTCQIIVTNVEKDSWRKFRGTALLNGFNSGSDWLRSLIKEYANGQYNETK